MSTATDENLGIACIFARNRHLKGVLDGRLVVVDRRGQPYLKIFRVGVHRVGWPQNEISPTR